MKNNSSKITGKSHRREISAALKKAGKYYQDKQYEQANYLYQQVVELEPENVLALNGLGNIAVDTGMLSLAVNFFSFAYDVDPVDVATNINLASTYEKMERIEDAIVQYLSVLDFDENNYLAHCELARLNFEIGNRDLAIHHYQYAFELNPEDPENLHGMLQVDAALITQENIDTVENILLKSDLPLDVRCSFYFLLGNIYDISGRYDEAFANYSVANLSKRSTFNTEKYDRFISGIIETFSAELFANFSSLELNNSNQPVFIVGMPRSGASIAEKILAEHNDVYSAGELNIIAGIAYKLSMTLESSADSRRSLEDLSAESLVNYARFYINDINDVAQRNGARTPARILNKLPENYLYLGLIALLFPNAHIIHCKRNPLDVCLSSYFQNESGNNGFACDLNNIAFYHAQYDSLMQHWEKVLPIQIHTVNYEDMVKAPQLTSKQLLDAIGLDTPDAVKDVNNALVNSRSKVRIRSRINQSSVDRWRHYEKYLHFMKKKLNEFKGKGSSSDSAGLI